jgi:hypothetical protein
VIHIAVPNRKHIVDFECYITLMRNLDSVVSV